MAYEKDVVSLIPEGPITGNAGVWRQFLIKHLLPSHTAKVKVLDQQGEPVSGAEVVVAGLNRSKTNKKGYARFYLPQDELCALIIRYPGHEEVLYQEILSRGEVYVYRPDPSIPAGRMRALTLETKP